MSDQTSQEPKRINDNGRDDALEKLRLNRAFALAVFGLALAAALAVLFVVLRLETSEITTLVGLFTGVLGTLVGTFFGLQIGSSGREEANSRAKLAQKNLNSVLQLTASNPEVAGKIRQELPDLFR